ncbi:hypothetical protein MYU51_015115 [Penicillium brevicompactum]|uniref:OPT superfamily oligopeptide transporter n=1 Tax=Penicillium brevicompactum TaxID=5074 RepID=UPI00253FE427|nr:OPT superfamily oligopeptide transporter [Penicillium brevicompactum]KAJ5348698.1 OPT superfamily oligopeptide transporter [Penicillium brevicompactum]
MSSPISASPQGIGVVEPSITTDNEKSGTPLVTLADLKDTKDETNLVEREATDEDTEVDAAIIVTGADVSAHLISMQDDHDTAINFRSFFLATGFIAFTAALSQIFNFKPSGGSVSTGLTLILSYFIGNAWARFLPSAAKLETRWKARGGEGKLPLWIKFIGFLNPGPFKLKEHAVIVLCANACGDNSGVSITFAAQKLFYNLPLSATTIVLSTISIGLFGYGIAGILRPIAVWHPECVYWGNLPLVKSMQDLHWKHINDSRQLRTFWYAVGGMMIYQIIPGYMFPWLNGVSIPCLASQKATGYTASVLTNLFGGSTNNEGLGLFSLCFDWQYLQSGSVTFPLKLQLPMAIGIGICSIVMIGIYYGDVWGSLSLPFMSTNLRTDNGHVYPVKEIFPGGHLDEALLEKHGIPRLTGTFAYSMLMANAAIGALILHVFLFWGKDVWQTWRLSMKGEFREPHHAYMAKNYKDSPWWWYICIAVLSFIIGIVVVVKEDITLPAWGYVVALLIGMVIAIFSTILFSRFGNGIATNNVSKMLAGLILPGLPVGNMYFSIWSHNVVTCACDLCGSFKMGDYLKIPPKVVLACQIYGCMLGAAINYVIMNYIVSSHRDLLIEGNGNSFWSGAVVQSYNTKAASWALAPHMYKSGARYEMVPIGMVIGAAAVLVHRLIYHFIPKVGKFDLSEINLPQLIQYSASIPDISPRTGNLLTSTALGFFAQYYLRNYRPAFFRDYLWILALALDAGSGICIFILTFAVMGVGTAPHPFPLWWGNNQNGYSDWCPAPSS